MNTATQKRLFVEDMKMSRPQIKTVVTHKYVEGLMKMFWIAAWIIAFTFTLYEIATKGIW